MLAVQRWYVGHGNQQAPIPVTLFGVPGNELSDMHSTLDNWIQTGVPAHAISASEHSTLAAIARPASDVSPHEG